MIAGLVAAIVVGLAELTGRRGVDLAATAYRVDQFRQHGYALWDFAWYGGHWTLAYSVVYPPLAAAIGVAGLAVVSAVVAAAAFDRLVRPRLGPGGWPASIVFALGTLVAASIGQMPFLTGEAFGMVALWAIDRRRWWLATGLALLSTLSSPLSGAFVALAAAAWALYDRSAWRQRVIPAGAVVAVSLIPTGLTALLFPGQGKMPYPFTDYLWEVVVALAIAALAWRSFPAVRTGALFLVVSASFAEAVPSALGGNVGRIEDISALPLAIGMAWSGARLLVPVLAVPLALSQWSPAWGALTSIPAAPSASRAFFAPLDRVLASEEAAGPPGRVEVVPTAYHWEAAYVATTMPLARGWERQLDEADNPLFYGGRLTPTTYRDWLLDNGVRFVALPAAPLDMAGKAEGALVASGRVPGLRPVWSSSDWRLYAVAGSPGIASGPGRLVSARGGRVVVDATGAGRVMLRIRYSRQWALTRGSGCVTRADGSWVALQLPRAEQVTLSLSIPPGTPPQCRPANLAAPNSTAG